jgi:site-specific DNA-cytosine methylase
MKHFDLFSGYGGFTIALNNVYENKNLRSNELANSERSSELYNVENELQQRECLDNNTIGFSEIDKYASAVLKYKYPNIKNYGDIIKINWEEVFDFDLLTGGSPCQDLSIAEKVKPMEGVIGVPKVRLTDFRGNRIIVKIKACDF